MVHFHNACMPPKGSMCSALKVFQMPQVTLVCTRVCKRVQACQVSVSLHLPRTALCMWVCHSAAWRMHGMLIHLLRVRVSSLVHVHLWPPLGLAPPPHAHVPRDTRWFDAHTIYPMHTLPELTFKNRAWTTCPHRICGVMR